MVKRIRPVIEERFVPMFVFDVGVTLEALVKAVNDVEHQEI